MFYEINNIFTCIHLINYCIYFHLHLLLHLSHPKLNKKVVFYLFGKNLYYLIVLYRKHALEAYHLFVRLRHLSKLLIIFDYTIIGSYLQCLASTLASVVLPKPGGPAINRMLCFA